MERLPDILTVIIPVKTQAGGGPPPVAGCVGRTSGQTDADCRCDPIERWGPAPSRRPCGPESFRAERAGGRRSPAGGGLRWPHVWTNRCGLPVRPHRTLVDQRPPGGPAGRNHSARSSHSRLCIKGKARESSACFEANIQHPTLKSREQGARERAPACCCVAHLGRLCSCLQRSECTSMCTSTGPAVRVIFPYSYTYSYTPISPFFFRRTNGWAAPHPFLHLDIGYSVLAIGYSLRNRRCI